MAPKNLPPVKPVAAAVTVVTRPGGLEPYVHGDAIPAPDAVEKDTDSVWEMWSDAVKAAPAAEQAEKDAEADALQSTILMDLDELPKDPNA